MFEGSCVMSYVTFQLISGLLANGSDCKCNDRYSSYLYGYHHPLCVSVVIVMLMLSVLAYVQRVVFRLWFTRFCGTAKMVTNMYDIIVQYMTTYIHTRVGCRTSCVHDYDECVGGSETSSLREGSIIAAP